MENIKKSIESFGFSLAGNELYIGETGLPLINILGDALRNIGIKEVADDVAEGSKGNIFAFNIDNEFFTQVIITFNEHEIIGSWLIEQILSLVKNKVVEFFKKKIINNPKRKNNSKNKGKVFISFTKNEKNTIVKLSAEEIDGEELSRIVDSVMKGLNGDSNNNFSFVSDSE